MKHKHFATTLVLFSVMLLFTQCKKSIEDLVNPKGTLTVINPTFTTIDITVNGDYRSIAPGTSVKFSGTAYALATGTASTAGKTTSGNVVGSVMNWNINEYFPGDGGNLDLTLNVGSDYFFLKVQNVSTLSIQKVYVNYGLVGQTLDNISIPNNGITYSLGYYHAYSNSNVRAESSSSYWYWNPLNLPFGNNQVKTLLAN